MREFSVTATDLAPGTNNSPKYRFQFQPKSKWFKKIEFPDRDSSVFLKVFFKCSARAMETVF